MKDWRDYATEVNGLRIAKPIRDPQGITGKSTKARSTTSKSRTSSQTSTKAILTFPRFWLYINIGLVGLCGLALIFGLWNSIYITTVSNPTNHSGFFKLLVEYTSLTFLVPGIVVIWIFTGKLLKWNYNSIAAEFTVMFSAFFGLV